MTAHKPVTAHSPGLITAPVASSKIVAVPTSDYLERLDAELRAGGFKGADDYYACKDAYWAELARLKGTTSRQLNPMNFWFGRQS